MYWGKLRYLSHYNCYSGRDLKPGPCKYKLREYPLDVHCSVCWVMLISHSHSQTFESNACTLRSDKYRARLATDVHATLFAYAYVVLQHLSVTSIALTSRIWPSRSNVRLEVRLTRFPKVHNKLPTTEGNSSAAYFRSETAGAHLFRVEKRELAFHLSVHLCIPPPPFFLHFRCFRNEYLQNKCLLALLCLSVRLLTAVTRGPLEVFWRNLTVRGFTHTRYNLLFSLWLLFKW